MTEMLTKTPAQCCTENPDTSVHNDYHRENKKERIQYGYKA